MKIALTGHRPSRLQYEDKQVSKWIREQLSNYECEECYCGMAQGADQLFAIEVIKKKFPLICCYPYKKNKFHPIEQGIINKAKEVKFIQKDFSKKCYFLRDKYMVDNCDILFAVWDGQKNGGTWLTIEYALKVGKPIIYYMVGERDGF